MKKITVNDKMQRGYQYVLVETSGRNFHSDFRPEVTPKEMLELGVFCGKYMTDCKNEFPKNWFQRAKLSPEKRNCLLNYFQIDASMPLSHWIKKGWIFKDDPRGWFQWYCRYYQGRRIKEEDERQIKRWKAIKRHLGAVKKNCKARDLNCRKKQRQVLLHWAYDPRKI